MCEGNLMHGARSTDDGFVIGAPSSKTYNYFHFDHEIEASCFIFISSWGLCVASALFVKYFFDYFFFLIALAQQTELLRSGA